MSEADVAGLRELLHSKKSQKTRRDGIKRLELLLDSPQFKAQLDNRTARIWPQDAIPLASWPGLLDVYLKHLKQGGDQSAKRAGGDVAGVKLLRRLLAAADDEERCGPNSCNVLRRVRQLFDYLADAIEAPGTFKGGAGTELCMLLQKQMLSVPAYCQRSNVQSFTRILNAVMNQAELLCPPDSRSTSRDPGQPTRLHVAPSEEAQRLCALALTLLQQMPGTVRPQVAVDVLAFAGSMAKWMLEHNDVSKLALHVMSLLQHVLLIYGHTLRGEALDTVAASVQPYLRRAWREARMPRLKEALVAYCRAALRLGALQAVGPLAVEEVQQLVVRDMTADDFAWATEGVSQGPPWRATMPLWLP